MRPYSRLPDNRIAMIINGFLKKPRLRIDLFWLRALYALKSWITTKVANAMVVDFMYAIVFVSRVSPNDQPYLYRFHMNTPVTMAAMKIPMYVNLDANRGLIMCFFGFLGG